MGYKGVNIWLAAYIVRDHISTVAIDLKKHGFKQVHACIPTVRILKKQSKGKNVFEEIPLLFNYGFFKMPYELATNYDELTRMRKRVPCIYSWVKDPTELLYKKPSLRMDNLGSLPKAGTVSEEEISRLLLTSEKLSVFEEDSVDKLEIGSFLTLKGFPYEGMPAEVVKINKKDRTVKVKLLLEMMMHEVQVSFENIFYTVYSDYDVESSDYREVSLDELSHRDNLSIDRLYASLNYGE